MRQRNNGVKTPDFRVDEEGGDKKDPLVSQELVGEADAFLDITRPFPVNPTLPVEDEHFTIRAVIVGIILGAVVSASNMYLCLKTGWTFGSSLFGT